MRMHLLALTLLTSGALFAGEEAAVFDKRIDAWAYGTVWGFTDRGEVSIQGQLSESAVEFAKMAERVIANSKDKAAHDTQKFEQLQAAMAKLPKREITLQFDKNAAPTLFQCPVKIPAESPGVPAKAQLTDLKIGDVVLMGYDADSSQNKLYAAILIENAKPNTTPGVAKPQDAPGSLPTK